MKNKIIYLLLFSFIFCSQTKYFETKNYIDFEEGTINNVNYTEEGILKLSPQTEELLSTGELISWKIFSDENNIFIGTGHDGIILKYNIKTKKYKKIEVSSPDIYAFAKDKNNNIYAGTGPKGMIYKITKQNKVDLFVVLKENYIWDMKIKENFLYISASSPGRIYKVNLKNKKKELIYESTENNIFKIIFDENKLLAVTSDEGYLISIDTENNNSAKILYDAGGKDINDVIVIKKGEYAIGTAGKKFESEPKTKKTKYEENSIKNSYYQNSFIIIDEKNNYNTIYNLRNDRFAALVKRGDYIYAGTFDEGEIYSYNIKTKIIKKVLKLQEGEILSFTKTKNRIYFTTGTSSKIHLLNIFYASDGYFISKIYDSKGLSKWGKVFADLTLPKKTYINFYARTGNTYIPDNSWSFWTQSSNNYIQNKNSRFIQYKIKLFTKNEKVTPEISNIKISYKTQNHMPTVKYVTFDGNDKFLKRNKIRLNLNSLLLKWGYYDEDNDKLIFSLYYKNNKKWFLLKDNIYENYYIIDKYKFPEGKYIFKVKVSDLPSNSKKDFLFSETKSQPLTIDNLPPVLNNIFIKDNILYFTITDSMSLLKFVQVSYNLKDFVYISSTDGIIDDYSENFKINLKENTEFVNVKFVDSYKNYSFVTIDLNKYKR